MATLTQDSKATKFVQFRAYKRLHNKAEELAFRNKRSGVYPDSLSAVCNEALREYLDRQPASQKVGKDRVCA